MFTSHHDAPLEASITRMLSNDCLKLILYYLSARQIYPLIASGDSLLRLMVNENVTVLEFDTPFLWIQGEEANEDRCVEASFSKASTFWHPFRNVTRFKLFSSPTAGLVIPQHMLRTIRHFEIGKSFEFAIQENSEITVVSTLHLTPTPLVNKFALPIDKMINLATLAFERIILHPSSLTTTFPQLHSTNITYLCIGSVNAYLDPSSLPRYLEYFETCGHFVRPAHGEGEITDQNSVLTSKQPPFKFPSTLTSMQWNIPEFHTENDILNVCNALPETMLELVLSASSKCEFPLQKPFDHALPKHLVYLGLFYMVEYAEDVERRRLYSHIDLKNLPPNIEKLCWTVQTDLSTEEEPIILPSTLKILNIRNSGFKANFWPNVFFPNRDIRISQVDVASWPIQDADFERSGLHHSMISSFRKSKYQYQRRGQVKESYFDKHPIPPSNTSLTLDHSDFPWPKYLEQQLPSHVSSLDIQGSVEFPSIIPLLSSSLTKLILELDNYDGLFFKMVKESKALPSTLLHLNVFNYNCLAGIDILDLSQLCPRLRTLIVKNDEYTWPVIVESLPPLLQVLELERIRTDLFLLCQHLTENIKSCTLKLYTEVLLNLAKGRQLVSSHVGSYSVSGWTFKLDFTLLGEFCAGGKHAIPDLLLQRLSLNGHLNYIDIECDKVRLRKRFQKRRDFSDHMLRGVIDGDQNLSRMGSRKRSQCTSGLHDDEDEYCPASKRKML